MFMGFLSKRTFSGFCSSYMRYCVRSYIRNVMIRDERVAAYRGEEGRNGVSPSGGAAGRIAPVRRGGWDSKASVTARWVKSSPVVATPSAGGRPAAVARNGGLRGGATRGRRG